MNLFTYFLIMSSSITDGVSSVMNTFVSSSVTKLPSALLSPVPGEYNMMEESMEPRVAVLLLALVVAVCCALPGIFVVLRKQSMITDAISHAVLPGIVIGAMITSDFSSPLLIVGAALSGLLVVIAAEYLDRSGLVTEDGAQGLLFPALFSIGVILLSVYFTDSVLNERFVLTGDLNFSSTPHVLTENYDLGPVYMWIMLGLLLIEVLFLTLFWRELVMSTFDREHATTIGIKANILHYALMILVAVVIVASFKAAGSVLVIALLIVPAAVGVLVSKTMWQMVLVTVGTAIFAAYLGFEVAYYYSISTSPMMSLIEGTVFLVAFALTFVYRWIVQRKAKKESMASVKNGDGVGAIDDADPSTVQITKAHNHVHADKTVTAVKPKALR